SLGASPPDSTTVRDFCSAATGAQSSSRDLVGGSATMRKSHSGDDSRMADRGVGATLGGGCRCTGNDTARDCAGSWSQRGDGCCRGGAGGRLWRIVAGRSERE